MRAITVRVIDTLLSIKSLQSGVRRKMAHDFERFFSKNLLEVAKRRAPLEIHDLKDSGYSRRVRSGADLLEYEVGFTSGHAEVQDTGFKKRVIRPVNPGVKFLFIPLSVRSRLRGGGIGPVKGGNLRYGRDFVLTKRVRTPRLRTGGQYGPNKYFTKTMTERPNLNLEARQLVESLLRDFY